MQRFLWVYKMSDAEILPDHARFTKVIAFHLYRKHYEEFLKICEEQERFHSEVLRELVLKYIAEYGKSDHKRPPFLPKKEKSVVEKILGE